MPTYVYRRADGTLFEAFQKMSDAPLAADPDTGEPVERVISGGAGLQFKGTGFYLTDYPRAGADGKPATRKDESAPSTPAPAAKEAKPAASPSKPAAASTSD